MGRGRKRCEGTQRIHIPCPPAPGNAAERVRDDWPTRTEEERLDAERRLFDTRINCDEARTDADSRPDYGTYALFQIEYVGDSLGSDAVQALVQVPYVSECSVDDNVVAWHNHGSAVIFTEVLEHPPTVDATGMAGSVLAGGVAFCNCRSVCLDLTATS